MATTILLFLLQDGIINGAVYGLVAIALVLVFAVADVILIPLGELVAFDNLRLGAFRPPRGERSARLEEIYARFPRLKERARQQAGTLSGGERQMLAMGRALMARPKVLMLDEPSLGLGPRIVREVFHILAEFKSTSVSILLIEQNARAALQIADRAYVWSSARLPWKEQQPRSSPIPRLVESYLGLGGAEYRNEADTASSTCRRKRHDKEGNAMRLNRRKFLARSTAATAAAVVASGQALKVLATKTDAVFIASAGSPAVLPQKALRESGYTGPIYQTHGIATTDFIRLGGKDVEGAVFAGEAFTVASDLPESSPFKKPTTDYIKAYQAAHGQPPPIFGAHVIDSVSLRQKAIPEALKAARPGTPQLRTAIRDELEKIKDLYLNNGLSNMTPTDHSGYDERSAFIIKIENGAFRHVT